MARPSDKARLRHTDRQREQVLAHPLARGLCPDEVSRFLAEVPQRRFPSVAYARTGKAAADPAARRRRRCSTRSSR
jgi:hypothetical protein